MDMITTDRRPTAANPLNDTPPVLIVPGTGALRVDGFAPTIIAERDATRESDTRTENDAAGPR
jgi:hypothetical protein